MQEVITTAAEAVPVVAQTAGTRLLSVTSEFAKTHPYLGVAAIAGTVIATAGLLTLRRRRQPPSDFLVGIRETWVDHVRLQELKLAEQAY